MVFVASLEGIDPDVVRHIERSFTNFIDDRDGPVSVLGTRCLKSMTHQFSAPGSANLRVLPERAGIGAP